MIKELVIIIPTYNEEQYVGACLDSLVSNDYDKQRMEIVVVDGRSTDNTRNVVSEYCREYDFIRMIDNPKRIKPAALNLALRSTDSDIVMRIDAHAVYPSNYISNLVEGLKKFGADNIGGVRKTHNGETLLQKAISRAISHRFAVGNASWRTGTLEVKEVETVFCGCYTREVFDKIGFFNEKLIRTQDREFNARLKAAGGRIILDPSVECEYYPRTKKIGDYIRWIFRGAFWLFYSRKFIDTKMFAWRNFIPIVFTLWILFTFIAAFFDSTILFVLLLPLCLYGILNLIFSAAVSYKERQIALFPPMSILFFLTHVSYGLGGIVGFLRYLIEGEDDSKWTNQAIETS